MATFDYYVPRGNTAAPHVRAISYLQEKAANDIVNFLNSTRVKVLKSAVTPDKSLHLQLNNGNSFIVRPKQTLVLTTQNMIAILEHESFKTDWVRKSDVKTPGEPMPMSHPKRAAERVSKSLDPSKKEIKTVKTLSWNKENPLGIKDVLTQGQVQEIFTTPQIPNEDIRDIATAYETTKEVLLGMGTPLMPTRFAYELFISLYLTQAKTLLDNSSNKANMRVSLTKMGIETANKMRVLTKQKLLPSEDSGLLEIQGMVDPDNIVPVSLKGIFYTQEEAQKDPSKEGVNYFLGVLEEGFSAGAEGFSNLSSVIPTKVNKASSSLIAILPLMLATATLYESFSVIEAAGPNFAKLLLPKMRSAVSLYARTIRKIGESQGSSLSISYSQAITKPRKVSVSEKEANPSLISTQEEVDRLLSTATDATIRRGLEHRYDEIDDIIQDTSNVVIFNLNKSRQKADWYNREGFFLTDVRIFTHDGSRKILIHSDHKAELLETILYHRILGSGEAKLPLGTPLKTDIVLFHPLGTHASQIKTIPLTEEEEGLFSETPYMFS